MHPPTHVTHTSSSYSKWAMISLSGAQHAVRVALHLLDWMRVKQLFSMVCLTKTKRMQKRTVITLPEVAVNFEKKVKIKRWNDENIKEYRASEALRKGCRGPQWWRAEMTRRTELNQVESWHKLAISHQPPATHAATVLSNETNSSSSPLLQKLDPTCGRKVCYWCHFQN